MRARRFMSLAATAVLAAACTAPAATNAPSGGAATPGATQGGTATQAWTVEYTPGDAEAEFKQTRHSPIAAVSRLHKGVGGGWAWLLLDRDTLKIASLHDADTPLVHDGMVPLFTLDVWEHAYYIDYRNERPKFASAVLSNIVNWEFVAQNLDGRGADRADQQPASARESEFTA